MRRITSVREGVIALALALCPVAAAEMLPVPFFAQQKNGCGAASVAMVMHYWGSQPGSTSKEYPSAKEVHEQLYRPELHGIPLAAMKRYMEDMGFGAFTLRGRRADLMEQLRKGRPIIVALKPKRNRAMHFAVVAGAEADGVWLNDPTNKKASRLDRVKFERQWAQADQWMLVAAPLRRESAGRTDVWPVPGR